MTLTPKEDFRNSLAKGLWAETVSTPNFIQASTAAMLEYAFRCAGDTNAGYKLQGAKEFLVVLMSLAESPLATEHINQPQLNRT